MKNGKPFSQNFSQAVWDNFLLFFRYMTIINIEGFYWWSGRESSKDHVKSLRQLEIWHLFRCLLATQKRFFVSKTGLRSLFYFSIYPGTSKTENLDVLHTVLNSSKPLIHSRSKQPKRIVLEINRNLPLSWKSPV